MIGGSCHKYHFCHVCRDKSMLVAPKRLPRHVRRDKLTFTTTKHVFVTTQHVFCRNKTFVRVCRNRNTVMTKVLLWQAYFCRDKAFVTTKMILVAAPMNDTSADLSICWPLSSNSHFLPRWPKLQFSPRFPAWKGPQTAQIWRPYEPWLSVVQGVHGHALEEQKNWPKHQRTWMTLADWRSPVMKKSFQRL